jgi:hypothetical protein
MTELWTERLEPAGRAIDPSAQPPQRDPAKQHKRDPGKQSGKGDPPTPCDHLGLEKDPGAPPHQVDSRA